MCNFTNCERPSVKKSWCNTHYNQVLQTGVAKQIGTNHGGLRADGSSRRPPDFDVDLAMTLYTSGESVSDISTMLSVSEGAVYYQFKKNNVSLRRERPWRRRHKSDLGVEEYAKWSAKDYLHRRRSSQYLGTLTIDEWLHILEELNHQCVYCGVPWEHMDHFIPLSKGGTHTADNVVPSCAPCNTKKSDKMPLDFINGKGG